MQSQSVGGTRRSTGRSTCWMCRSAEEDCWTAGAGREGWRLGKDARDVTGSRAVGPGSFLECGEELWWRSRNENGHADESRGVVQRRERVVDATADNRASERASVDGVVVDGGDGVRVSGGGIGEHAPDDRAALQAGSWQLAGE